MIPFPKGVKPPTVTAKDLDTILEALGVKPESKRNVARRFYPDDDTGLDNDSEYFNNTYTAHRGMKVYGRKMYADIAADTSCFAEAIRHKVQPKYYKV